MSSPPQPRIIVATDRLLIRHFTTDDAPAMQRIFCDAQVMRFSTTGVRDAAWVREWINGQINTYNTCGYGLWAVVETERDQTIGYCGLTHYPDIDRRAEIEIGYRLARTHWNQGYATEAAIAVRDYAFDTLGLSRLIALIDPHNTASIRVADKLGMNYEKDVMLEGYDYPDRLYSIERRR